MLGAVVGAVMVSVMVSVLVALTMLCCQDIELLLQEALRLVRQQSAARLLRSFVGQPTSNPHPRLNPHAHPLILLRSFVGIQHFREKNSAICEWLVNGCAEAEVRALARWDTHTHTQRERERERTHTQSYLHTHAS